MRRVIHLRTCGSQISDTCWTRTFRHQSGLSAKFHKTGRTRLVLDLRMPRSGEPIDQVGNRHNPIPARIDFVYQNEVLHV